MNKIERSFHPEEIIRTKGKRCEAIYEESATGQAEGVEHKTRPEPSQESFKTLDFWISN